MPGPFAPPGGMYPALYLYPLNDSFVPKHICLAGGQRVKIGRQTNAKTVPAERNGFFDSKVLSRQHAEVWEEAGKIYIKDVKSSNGTFINGERLSPEGHESEPFELKTEDIVEFGIDIVGEDNKTVVHHKVAARVTCVFNDNDAASAQRSEASGSMGGPMNGFNFGGPNGSAGPRRPGIQQPTGLGGMGGMSSMRPPGKSGLTFDHIISRLQGELQKSRETGADLHSLTSVMGEVHDTLGGQLPNQLPPFPAQLGPVRPPAPENAGSSAGSDNGSASASVALGELQEQLRETQSSLAGHVDKVRALEGVLAEHDAIKREVANLRETLSVRPSQPKMALQRVFEHTEQEEGHSEFDAESDDDDIRSVGTAVPHELDRVEEEDEEALRSASDEEEAHRAPRPRTPEPGSLGLDDDEHRPFKARSSRPLSGGHFTDISLSDRPASPHTSIPDELSQRLTTLASQLETALELSRTLQQQQQQAQSTISALHEKVAMLEGRVQVTEDAVEHTAAVVEEIKSAPAPTSPGVESLSNMMSEFKKHVEGKWSGVQEEWTSERERLRRATEEWERRAGALEDSVNGAVSRVDAGLERAEGLVRLNAATAQAINDVRNHGLATPPSPRSLSADSPRSPRMRRRRGSRGSSHSGSSASIGVDMHPALESSSSGSGSEGTSAPSSLALSFIDSPRRMKMPWSSRAGAADLDEDVHEAEDQEIAKPAKSQSAAKSQTHLAPRKGDAEPGQLPLTPKASFEEPSQARSAEVTATKTPPDLYLAQYSSALGVVVLSVAAAAVMYRVKPDFAS